MAEPRFDIPGVVNAGVLADVLRLEVETDPTGLANLVVNPDGRLGGWGWISPVAGTRVRSSTSGAQALEFVTATTSVATNYTTELMAVTAGQYVAARWAEKGFTDLAGAAQSSGYYRARFEFVNAAGALVSSSAQTSYLQITASGVIRTVAPVVVPATATRVRLRLDAYSNTSAANPTANRVYALTSVTVATAATSAELGGTVRTNVLTNPSMTTNATGWQAPVGEGSVVSRVAAPATMNATEVADMGFGLKVAIGGGGLARATETATHAATALSRWYARARFAVRVTATATGAVDYLPSGDVLWLMVQAYNGATAVGAAVLANHTLTLGERDANGWVYFTLEGYYDVPASGVTGLRLDITNNIEGSSLAGGASYLVDRLLLEKVAAGTSGSRTYFDGATTDADGWVYDWTGTANASTSTATSTNLDYIEPVPLIDVMGPTHQITVTRGELEVGTLTAEILDATIDPAVAPLIRPGRTVRLSALTSAGDWATIYTGTLDKAKVRYHLLENIPDEKRARVTLEASDNVATLAAAQRPQAVATIAELPYVLEGAAVPWNVNGSGNQVATATVRATADGTTALDQIALTRDTVHGFAWVDVLNVVQAWDASQIPTASVLDLDEDVYTDTTIGFDTDACINEVSVTVRSTDSTGQTLETTTVHTDAVSIAKWGRHRAEFTVLAPTTAATFAAEVLAANANPTIRMTEVMVNVREASLLDVAHLDLYDAVTLVNVDKGIDQLARVSSIKMDIDPEGWFIDLGFGDPGAVASPQTIPPLPAGGNNAAQPYSMAAGSEIVNVSAAVSGAITVTFPAGRFTAAPMVVPGVRAATAFIVSVSAITTTGCTFTVRHVDNVSSTTTVGVHWHAYQMTPTSGVG